MPTMRCKAQKIFNAEFEMPKYAGWLVHSDLCGNFSLPIHDHKQFCTFVDQFTTRYTHVVGIRKNVHVVDVFEGYKKLGQVTKV